MTTTNHGRNLKESVLLHFRQNIKRKREKKDICSLTLCVMSPWSLDCSGLSRIRHSAYLLMLTHTVILGHNYHSDNWEMQFLSATRRRQRLKCRIWPRVVWKASDWFLWKSCISQFLKSKCLKLHSLTSWGFSFHFTDSIRDFYTPWWSLFLDKPYIQHLAFG